MTTIIEIFQAVRNGARAVDIDLDLRTSNSSGEAGLCEESFEFFMQDSQLNCNKATAATTFERKIEGGRSSKVDCEELRSGLKAAAACDECFLEEYDSADTMGETSASISTEIVRRKREEEESRLLLLAVKNVIIVNGPMDLVSLEGHLHGRGLDSRILHWICNDDLTRYSPTHMLHRCIQEDKDIAHACWEVFPDIAVIDCDDDCSIPKSQGVGIFSVLQAAGDGALNILHRTYQDKSHTSLVVDDLLGGDYSFCYDVDGIIHRNRDHRNQSEEKTRGVKGSQREETVVKDLKFAERRTAIARKGARNGVEVDPAYTEAFAPERLVMLARYISPF